MFKLKLLNGKTQQKYYFTPILMVRCTCTFNFVVIFFGTFDNYGGLLTFGERSGRDRMLVGFTTTCGISAYHH
jgi:hypothetical protein